MVKMNTESKIRIAIVDVGERLEIKLNRLARKLNSLQSSFVFSAVTPITVAKVGDPHIEEEWYEFQHLFDILRCHNACAQHEYLVGVTHLKVTERDTSTGLNRGDYFSLSDFEKVAVISKNRSVLRFNSPSKTRYQYLAYLLICELLMLISKHDMIHTLNNYCLFDDCVDRTVLMRCIEHGEICEKCISTLKEHNISQQMILDARKILKWCKTDSIKYSLSKTILHPFTLLAIGTSLGWIAKSFIAPNQYHLVFLFLFIIPIIMFMRIRYTAK